MVKTINITVIGKVQGVYYRQSTKEKARELAITGFVRNLSDGSVEIIASGTDDQLNQLIKWCQIGPSRAIVSKVIIKEIDYQPYNDFVIDRSRW